MEAHHGGSLQGILIRQGILLLEIPRKILNDLLSCGVDLRYGFFNVEGSHKVVTFQELVTNLFF